MLNLDGGGESGAGEGGYIHGPEVIKQRKLLRFD